MTTLVVRGPCAVDGEATVPGDKSISHRALMLGSLATGATTVRNIASGEDVASTIACLERYGVRVTRNNGDVAIEGRGMRSWAEPTQPLDCGNSGTTMRLLAGLAAHNVFPSILDGDASLRRRPMNRIVGPLTALGARVETKEGHPPVVVRGGRLSGNEIDTEIPSAQVKSCALFAAMGADGRTVVTEPTLSRDHTERMLRALGASINESHERDGRHRVDLMHFAPPAFELDVAGDPSSAAFVVAAGVLTGSVRMADVALNPTRIGLLEVLRRMGAAVRWGTAGDRMGEPVGWIEAERSDLAAVGIEGPLVPLMLDELPLLALLATQARGTTVVTGAAELRVKESDRIAAIASGLGAMGADVDALPDGFAVHGPTPLAATKVDTAGDHRIAMMLAVAGLVADGETIVDGFECAAVSWPGFESVLASLGADVEIR